MAANDEAPPAKPARAPAFSPGFWRKVLLSLWRLALILAVLCFVHPIKDNFTRLGTVGGLFCVWAGAMILWWRVKPVRIAGIVVAAIALAVAILPGRPIDPSALRAADTRGLTEYDGARYLWGGESTLGIDCSGLIRRGMIEAYLAIGFRTLNPAALREAFTIYWHDCSADDLGQGYRGRTEFVMNAKSINSANMALLHPGDMAVVDDGDHILAYLGGGVWIDADPKGPWRVERVHVPAPKNGWFELPARIVRWRSLA